MKLTLALLSLLPAALPQELEYARINKLRGAELSSPKLHKIHLQGDGTSNKVHLDHSTLVKLQTGDDAADLAACAAHTSSAECVDTCSWCESKAVSSACYPASMVGRLPAGVFECGSAAKSSLKEEKVEKKETGRSESFNLKEGITMTLSSDAVDGDFCDPNSQLSLAGYMNGELCHSNLLWGREKNLPQNQCMYTSSLF